MTLVLLAGGRGTRLGGVPKGLVLREGRPLLAHQLELAPLVADVLLVANDAEPYAAFGLRTVADVVPDRGPLGGLVTALQNVRTPWALCVACDLPFVTPEAVRVLLAAREGVDAVVFAPGGRLEPMLAVWSVGLGPLFESQLARPPSFEQLLSGLPGDRKARRLGDEVLGRLPGGECLFANVNSRDDLVRFGLRLP